MPSPRSNRTTATRPSGPRPFSMVTKSDNAHASLPALYVSSQMAGTLARRSAFRRWKPDRGSERDPVGVFALDIAAIDQVDRENLVGPVTHAGLKPWPGHARNVGLAGLPEGFQRQLQ